MASLLVLLSSLLLAADDLQIVGAPPLTAPFFNCDGNDLKSPDNCTATRWCVWSTATGTCVYDACLSYVSKEQYNDYDGADPNSLCPSAGVTCNLFYVTDTHDCNTGVASGFDDLYCRTKSDGLVKVPVDDCFFQDLKARSSATDPKTSCVNIPGGASCTPITKSDNYYCYQNDQKCSDYFNEVDSAGIPTDRTGFCNCLGTKNCNLYPYCALSKASPTTCIADPCGYATASGSSCTGAGIAVTNCGVGTGYRGSGGTTPETVSICITTSSPSSATVQVNDWNECYFGIVSKVSYVNPLYKYPECATVTENNICETLLANGKDDEKCQVKPIAANIFLPAVSNYCTDGAPNHEPPSPDGANSIRVPVLFAFLALFVLMVL